MNDYIQNVLEFIGKIGTYLKNIKSRVGSFFFSFFGFLFDPPPLLIYFQFSHTYMLKY